MIKLIKNSYQDLTRGEKSFVFLVSFVILFLTLLPLIFGFSTASDNQFYTSSTFIAGADKMIYFSQIEEISQGKLFFHNLYTSEPQPVGIFSPLWLALGWVKKITGFSSEAVFHSARVVLGFIFLWLIYLFLARIFKRVKWRKIVFLLIGLGSGLGIFTLSGNFSEEHLYEHLGTDFWVSESNTFLSIYHSPLFIFSQILIVIIFWWAIERLTKASFYEVIIMGLVALILGLTHPYDLIIVFSVLGVWFLIKSLKIKRWPWPFFFKLFVIGLISGLSLVYFYFLQIQSPAFSEWLKQNITLSPKIINYFIGYGFIFLLYLLVVFKAAKSKNKYIFFLAIWSLVGWFLLYSPIQFQRKLANGLHLPLAILAGQGLVWLVYFLKAKLKNRGFLLKVFILNLTVILLVSSNFFIITMDLKLISAKAFPMYISGEQFRGINWLRDNLEDNEIILGSSPMANLIPAFSAKKVYIGHGHQTADWLEKKDKVNNLFFASNTADGLKEDWLESQRIDYLFFSSREDLLGDFNPFEKKYLQLVWQEGQAAIFKVVVNSGNNLSN